MNYRAYFTDYQGNKKVKTFDEIRPGDVELVVGVYYGTPIAIVLESDPQPADAADYEELSE